MIKNRMKEHRARCGMKQEDLAARVGVRRETIGNLENGRYNPSLVLAWHIAVALGLPFVDDFPLADGGVGAPRGGAPPLLRYSRRAKIYDLAGI